MRPDLRVVIPSLAGGGSERVCVTLANHWTEQGRRIEVLLVRGDGELARLLHGDVSRRIAGKRRVREAVAWLCREVNRYETVPVLAFGPDVGVVLGLLRRAGLIQAPLIYREGSLPQSNVSPSSQWIYKQAIAHFDGIIAQTRFAAQQLRELVDRNVETVKIYNPVTARPIPVVFRPVRAPFRLLAVGRLSPEKGFDKLIDAIARPPVRCVLADLTIAGRGGASERLAEQVVRLGLDGMVSMPGFVDQPQRLFRDRDLFVMPSVYEGMPNALLEAVICGCRVLASGGDGVKELLGEIGLSECYMGDSDWSDNLADWLQIVSDIPIDRLESARAQLLDLAAVGRIAGSYYDFCASIVARQSCSI